MIFHSHANKTHFHKRGCALGLISKVKGFGTRKWPIKDHFLVDGFAEILYYFFSFQGAILLLGGGTLFPRRPWRSRSGTFHFRWICPVDRSAGQRLDQSCGILPLAQVFSSMHCFFVFFLFGFIVILCFFKGQYPWEFVQFVQVFLSTRWKPLIVTCSCMLQCQYEKMHLWLTFPS